MKLFGALVFATVCVAMMIYTFTVPTRARPDDASTHSPLRRARRA